MTGTYKIADRIIKIESLHGRVHSMCADYVCDGDPDITVITTQSDIDFEKDQSPNEDGNVDLSRGHDGYLETLAVYRKIAIEMLNTILFCSTARQSSLTEKLTCLPPKAAPESPPIPATGWKLLVTGP